MSDARAYLKGFRAYGRGLILSDCPYHKASSAMAKNAHEWERGWRDAEREIFPDKDQRS